MVKASYLESLDLHKVVNEWLKHFEAALSKNKFDAAANLFVDQGQWRDLLAFTWHVQTMSGRQEILHAAADNAQSKTNWIISSGGAHTSPSD